MIARSVLLRPGGLLASELARHSVVLKINDWVFCHGGLLPHHGNSLVSEDRNSSFLLLSGKNIMELDWQFLMA